tara:strand:+ start:59 stop:523 length:465 start_codon:yes stop_codon:yes gene_type:complete
MADSFKIKYSSRVVPIESLEAVDGTLDRRIHSNIDKFLGGSNEMTFSATSSKVNYKDYTTTTGYVSLEHSTIFDDANLDIDFWYMGIREAASTGTPDVQINITGVSISFMKLQGVGDFLIIPMIASDFPGNAITIRSTGSTTLAKLDILVGEIE